jgi:hypothetical protein
MAKWKKGQSGNIKGPAKGVGSGRPSTDIRKYYQGLWDKYEIGNRMVLIATNSDPSNNPFPPEVVWKALVFITEMAWGKAKESVELSGKDGEPLTVNVVNYGSNRTAQLPTKSLSVADSTGD